MERGGRIVVIAPEYGAPSTKADYWIPIRPATDAALWLGVTRLMMDRGWYDEKFVREFTDFPLLVRTDNLKRLRAEEVFAIGEEAVREVEEREEMMPMERAKHRLARAEGMKDPSGEDEPFEGGSAT